MPSILLENLRDFVEHRVEFDDFRQLIRGSTHSYRWAVGKIGFCSSPVGLCERHAPNPDLADWLICQKWLPWITFFPQMGIVTPVKISDHFLCCMFFQQNPENQTLENCSDGASSQASNWTDVFPSKSHRNSAIQKLISSLISPFFKLESVASEGGTRGGATTIYEGHCDDMGLRDRQDD